MKIPLLPRLFSRRRETLLSHLHVAACRCASLWTHLMCKTSNSVYELWTNRFGSTQGFLRDPLKNELPSLLKILRPHLLPQVKCLQYSPNSLKPGREG